MPLKPTFNRQALAYGLRISRSEPIHSALSPTSQFLTRGSGGHVPKAGDSPGRVTEILGELQSTHSEIQQLAKGMGQKTHAA